MQDNAYREQAKIKTYPTPTIKPVNQLITSPVEADMIAEAAQREADNIMAIAFQSGPDPPEPHKQPSLSNPQPPRPTQQPRRLIAWIMEGNQDQPHQHL